MKIVRTKMTDKVKPQKQNNKKARSEFVQTRKALTYTLQFQSDAMLRYMGRNGGMAAGAFQRIAGLIQFTANNTEVRERLDTWFEGVMKTATERAIGLNHQQEKYSDGLIINIEKPKVPDNYNQVIEITHPVFWQFIGLVEMLDSVMAEIEFLWLAGHLEDVHLENANGRAVNTVRELVNRIYYVTTASRNREGGLYSAKAFKELMSALNKGELAPDHVAEDEDDKAKEVAEAKPKEKQQSPAKEKQLKAQTPSA